MWNIGKRLLLLAIIWLFKPILFLVLAYRVLVKNDERMYFIARSFDIYANTTFNGRPDETISSRTGRALLKRKKWAILLAPLIDAIFGEGHCVSSAIDYIQQHPELSQAGLL